MLRFLFGTKPEKPVKVETQRETFERLVTELNEALVALSVKPKVTIDPATGGISFETPEQFPDEALALPSPDKSEVEEKNTEESGENASEGNAEDEAEKEKAA